MESIVDSQVKTENSHVSDSDEENSNAEIEDEELITEFENLVDTVEVLSDNIFSPKFNLTEEHHEKIKERYNMEILDSRQRNYDLLVANYKRLEEKFRELKTQYFELGFELKKFREKKEKEVKSLEAAIEFQNAQYLQLLESGATMHKDLFRVELSECKEKCNKLEDELGAMEIKLANEKEAKENLETEVENLTSIVQSLDAYNEEVPGSFDVIACRNNSETIIKKIYDRYGTAMAIVRKKLRHAETKLQRSEANFNELERQFSKKEKEFQKFHEEKEKEVKLLNDALKLSQMQCQQLVESGAVIYIDLSKKELLECKEKCSKLKGELEAMKIKLADEKEAKGNEENSHELVSEAEYEFEKFWEEKGKVIKLWEEQSLESVRVMVNKEQFIEELSIFKEYCAMEVELNAVKKQLADEKKAKENLEREKEFSEAVIRDVVSCTTETANADAAFNRKEAHEKIVRRLQEEHREEVSKLTLQNENLENEYQRLENELCTLKEEYLERQQEFERSYAVKTEQVNEIQAALRQSRMQCQQFLESSKSVDPNIALLKESSEQLHEANLLLNDMKLQKDSALEEAARLREQNRTLVQTYTNQSEDGIGLMDSLQMKRLKVDLLKLKEEQLVLIVLRGELEEIEQRVEDKQKRLQDFLADKLSMTAEMREQMETELKAEMEEKLRQELQNEIQTELKREMVSKLKESEKRIRNELCDVLKKTYEEHSERSKRTRDECMKQLNELTEDVRQRMTNYGRKLEERGRRWEEFGKRYEEHKKRYGNYTDEKEYFRNRWAETKAEMLTIFEEKKEELRNRLLTRQKNLATEIHKERVTTEIRYVTRETISQV